MLAQVTGELVPRLVNLLKRKGRQVVRGTIGVEKA
jgi:hypothetical protein